MIDTGWSIVDIKINSYLKKGQFSLLLMLLATIVLVFSSTSEAGIALGATRVIYPAGQKQVQLPVTSNDEKSVFLIQSWVEDQNGNKDERFVITPPLFTMQGKKENILRIIDATKMQLPQDRESLFWINVKAIPSLDKSKSNENILQLAVINKIKLYYRPENLSMAPNEAVDKLSFHRNGSSLILVNPTPYYLTVTDIAAGNQKLNNALVPPMGEASINLPANAGQKITWRTINDYGALTPIMESILK